MSAPFNPQLATRVNLGLAFLAAIVCVAEAVTIVLLVRG